MTRPATDVTLWDWRYGQTLAERLCADLLQVEGFVDVDPQCPLGGPDGKKDILCSKDGEKWLAAIYFPPTRTDFRGVKAKFCDDFKGVSLHKRERFAFFTNQLITPGERSELALCAKPIPVELFHQERIRSILDSPRGYGLRLEYLRIPMTEEEQLSLWSTLKEDLTAGLKRQENRILDLHRKIDVVLERTNRIGSRLDGRSSLEIDPPAELTQFPTANLQLADLFWIHRLLCDRSDLPHTDRGRIRNINVWIGKPGSTPDKARYTPPPPEKIVALLEDLLGRWRAGYKNVSGADENLRIEALTSFHHGFLNIHPFLDGNGRVARALLQQQVFELTGRHLEAAFRDNLPGYFDALSAADGGDYAPLKRMIRINLE
jgi:fido (protein-threonine AMPylation protein)